MPSSRGVFQKLTHKVNVAATTITLTGDRTSVSVQNDVPCYIVPKSRRFLSTEREEISTTHDVYMSIEGVDIDVGYFLSGGIDVDNITLISTAVVEFVGKWSHPFRGFETVVLSVKAI